VGREVKDALGRNAVWVNGDTKGNEDNMKSGEVFSMENALYQRFFLVKLGKKKNHLFYFVR
jgi:tyrosyl-tRNA synthetase